MERKWITFENTVSYEGEPLGPAIVDANEVVTVETLQLGSRIERRRATSTFVGLCVGNSSVYIDMPFADVIAALGIK